MRKFNYIFVVLVYKNTIDLVEFLDNLQKMDFSYKVIIVDSYYDAITMNQVKEIANINNCDFVSIDNKGYSYGNNVGIEYCLKHYIFDYLIVCNPDVIITEWQHLNIMNEPVIFAPVIYTLRGKNQNPYWAINCHFANRMIYFGYKHNNKLFLLVGIGINKVIRELFNILTKILRKEIKIYAPHGSFIIFNRHAINKLKPVFDPNVFLFSEEAILAKRAKTSKVKIIMTNKIKILHKEDGSISISKINENTELAKSYIYYFERYEK